MEVLRRELDRTSNVASSLGPSSSSGSSLWMTFRTQLVGRIRYPRAKPPPLSSPSGTMDCSDTNACSASAISSAGSSPNLVASTRQPVNRRQLRTVDGRCYIPKQTLAVGGLRCIELSLEITAYQPEWFLALSTTESLSVRRLSSVSLADTRKMQLSSEMSSNTNQSQRWMGTTASDVTTKPILVMCRERNRLEQWREHLWT